MSIVRDPRKVSIYLDISQDEIISCQVKCRYDRSGKEYLLYDEADRSVRNNGFEEELRRVTGKYFNAYDETNKSMCLSGGPEELYHFLTESVTELGKSGEVFLFRTRFRNWEGGSCHRWISESAWIQVFFICRFRRRI